MPPRLTAVRLDRLCAPLTPATRLSVFVVHTGARPGGRALVAYWGAACERVGVEWRIKTDRPEEMQILVTGTLRHLVQLPGTPAEIAAWLAPELTRVVIRPTRGEDAVDFARAPEAMRLAALTRAVRRLRPAPRTRAGTAARAGQGTGPR